ncbi:TPA: hypothetical protein EYP66_24360 [Candidatus Poribacteria bacterium]|nr:hypothetical protein [Candidatus Poribacteria bacterium]
MSEERKSVLIASLGMGPGVITSAVDALRKELGENFSLEKVVTLSTIGRDIAYKDPRSGEVIPEGFTNILIKEFEQNYRDGIEYIYICIDYSDMDYPKACDQFLATACQQIDKYHNDDYDVYVSLAGGRKSMAGILSVAAQFYGAKMLFHVAITNERERQVIEEHGSDLNYILRNRDRILHPSSAKLVKLPFLNLRALTRKITADLRQYGNIDVNTRSTLEVLEIDIDDVVMSIRDLNRVQETLDKSYIME